MEIKVAHHQGGDKRVEVEIEEGPKSRGVLGVIIEVHNSPRLTPYPQIDNLERGVCNKVVAGRSADCVLLEGMATAMDPDVDHNLGALVERVVHCGTAVAGLLSLHKMLLLTKRPSHPGLLWASRHHLFQIHHFPFQTQMMP
jgi:hypothetical protein